MLKAIPDSTHIARYRNTSNHLLFITTHSWHENSRSTLCIFQTANALIKNTYAWTSTDREFQLGTQVCIAQLTDFIDRLEPNPSAFLIVPSLVKVSGSVAEKLTAF
ncbi:hypothetical protein CEXT_493081 [Caerostris extrusa]|uniref:Uncharacterized protein n=1 Tax=Caerostris extrusa TaxID=172846 RepID=A0AAV4S1X6_CAEEX|nr:hypothetical protein CEXT_493081 [Caerostris extrusa]